MHPRKGGYGVPPSIESGDRRGRRPVYDVPPNGEGSTDPATDESALSEDDVFEVLYNRRRRQVIEYLRESEGTATVGEVAEHIAARENDTTTDQLTSYERKRVYVSLYQNHLPVMDDANVVTYDDGRKTIQLEEAASELDGYLQEGSGRKERLTAVATPIAIATSVLFGGLQIGVFAVVPAWTWTVVGVVGLLGLVSPGGRRPR